MISLDNDGKQEDGQNLGVLSEFDEIINGLIKIIRSTPNKDLTLSDNNFDFTNEDVQIIFDNDKDIYQFDGSESTDLSEVGLCSINSCELLFNIIICLICYLE